MDIREFSIEWLKKKYPTNEFYLTTVNDDVVEFARGWTEHVLDLLLEEFRDLTKEGEASWWYVSKLEEIIADLESENQPS